MPLEIGQGDPLAVQRRQGEPLGRQPVERDDLEIEEQALDVRRRRAAGGEEDPSREDGSGRLTGECRRNPAPRAP